MLRRGYGLTVMVRRTVLLFILLLTISTVLSVSGIGLSLAYPSPSVYRIYGKPILLSYAFPRYDSVSVLGHVRGSVFVGALNRDGVSLIALLNITPRPVTVRVLGPLLGRVVGYAVDSMPNSTRLAVLDSMGLLVVYDLQAYKEYYLRAPLCRVSRVSVSRNTLLVVCPYNPPMSAGILGLYDMSLNSFTFYTPGVLGSLVNTGYQPSVIDAILSLGSCSQGLCYGVSRAVGFLAVGSFNLTIIVRYSLAGVLLVPTNITNVIVVLSGGGQQYVLNLPLSPQGVARAVVPYFATRLNVAVYIPYVNVTSVGNRTVKRLFYYFTYYPNTTITRGKLTLRVYIPTPFRVEYLPFHVPRPGGVYPAFRLVPRLYMAYYSSGRITGVEEVPLPLNMTLYRVLGVYSFPVYSVDGFRFAVFLAATSNTVSAIGGSNYLVVAYLTSSFRPARLPRWFGVMALPAPPSSIAVSSDGRVVLLCCSDGSILVFTYAKGVGYKLSYTYRIAGSNPKALFLWRSRLADFFAITSNGVAEIVGFDPKGVNPPIMYFKYVVFRGFVFAGASVSYGGGLLVGCLGRRVYVVYGLSVSRIGLVLYSGVNLVIRLVDPLSGVNVSGASITIYYHGRRVVVATTNSSGSVVVVMLPPGDYKVVVKPPASFPWLYETTITIRIPASYEPKTIRCILALRTVSTSRPILLSTTRMVVVHHVLGLETPCYGGPLVIV